MRFHSNQTLPSNIKVVSAKLRLTNNRGKEQKVTTSFELRAETNQNPASFLCTQFAPQPVPSNNLPSQRTVTQAVSQHTSDKKWVKDSIWEIDATVPLQELSKNGQLNQHLALILKGTNRSEKSTEDCSKKEKESKESEDCSKESKDKSNKKDQEDKNDDNQLGKRYFFNHRQKGIALSSLPKLVIEYQVLSPPPTPPVANLIKLSFNNQDIATINGEAGSVAANLQVIITNLRTNETLTTTANATGSFSATISAKANDSLRLMVSNPATSQQSTPISLIVPLPALPVSPELTLIKATLNQTNAQITGLANSVISSIQVIVFNTVNNQQVTTTSNVDGSFSATLPATGGETLLIYVVDRYNQQSVGVNVQVPLPAPPAAPNLSLINLTVNQGIAQIVGSANSVIANLPVTILNTSNNQKVTTTAAADGSFSATLPVNGGEKLSIFVTDNYNQNSASITLNIPIPVTPIHLNITYPATGATLSNRLTKVEGTHDGLSNTGILINGKTALVSNGRFVADNVPLQAGANTLTVTAFSLQGKAGEATANVSAIDNFPLLTLSTNWQSGLAPFEATFKYNFSGTLPFTNLTLDFEGDGVVDFNTADNTATLPSHIYSNAGWYSPTITLTDAQGTTHTAQTILLVQDPNQIDAMFLEMWQGMNNALIAKDKTTALQFLNAGAQRKYSPVFDTLMPYMSQIVASYSPLARSEVSESIGEYAIVRPYQGKRMLFFIYFLKGKDGIWRIDEM